MYLLNLAQQSHWLTIIKVNKLAKVNGLTVFLEDGVKDAPDLLSLVLDVKGLDIDTRSPLQPVYLFLIQDQVDVLELIPAQYNNGRLLIFP